MALQSPMSHCPVLGYFPCAVLAQQRCPSICLDVGDDVVDMGKALLAAAADVATPPPTLFNPMTPTPVQHGISVAPVHHTPMFTDSSAPPTAGTGRAL